MAADGESTLRNPFAPALLATLLAMLNGCDIHDPSLRQRDTRDGAGLPHRSPPGVIVSQPPADSSADRLRCVPDGQSVECSRQ